MFYDKESDFEDDLVAVLKRHGWTDGVLEYPTEQDLIDNWANILFDNNKGIDRLNGQRLTKGEMAQILEQIETLRTPLALNSFINGKTVSIKPTPCRRRSARKRRLRPPCVPSATRLSAAKSAS